MSLLAAIRYAARLQAMREAIEAMQRKETSANV